jgi:G3E family GTPase
LSDGSPEFTPVTLVTGFLGSGKTTLLQLLLRELAFADTAVLINELGEIALDHHLLERIDETMVVLKSGCLCCTIRGELSAAIKDLHERRELGLVPPFRRLVIESTGLADPFPILSTVQADPVLRHHFSLGNVITTVDAVNGMRQLDEYPESVKQAAIAGHIVVTKTDLAPEGAVAALIARLGRLNPTASLWHDANPAIDAAALLSDDPFGAEGNRALHRLPADPPPGGHDHTHSDGCHHDDEIRTISLTFDEPIDWAAFGMWLTMLLHRHGDDVLRVKGILNITGADTPVALHGVQHLIHPPKHLSAWPDTDRRSRLVFIVKGLAPTAIEKSIRAFCTISPVKHSPLAAE